MVCGAGQVGAKLKAAAQPDKDPACRVAGLVPLLYRAGPGAFAGQDLLEALGVAHFPDLIADSAEYEFLLQRLAFERGELVEELLVAVGVCWHNSMNKEISRTGCH